MKSSNIFAIVPAAGRGERMGAGHSKVLLKLAGKTIIERTLETLLAHPQISKIILLVPASEEELFRALPIKDSRLRMLRGGASRRESVSLGLQEIDTEAQPKDLVLIHDGARCCLSSHLLKRCIEAAIEHLAVSAAFPIVETVKRVGADGIFQDSVDRSGLYAMQTPQVFNRDLIMRAHKECNQDATDDVSLVEHLNPVKLVLGERENIKITTPEDLVFAEKLLNWGY